MMPFRVEFLNRSDRALRLETDIGDNVIPAGKGGKVSVGRSRVIYVHDAGDQRETVIAQVPADYDDRL